MENKNNPTSGVSQDDAAMQLSSSVVVGQESFSNSQALSDYPMATGDLTAPVVATVVPNTKSRLRWGLLLATAVLFIAAASFVTFNALNRSREGVEENASNRFGTTVVSLDSISVEPIINLSNTKMVTINGTLAIREGLIVAPSIQPSTAQPGQIYYDINSNTLAYFNGTQFVSVAGDVVKDIDGATGNVAVGAGLSNIDGQIVNTGVLSIQGQTGNVTLTPGNGITINGTTISNSGIVSVVSSTPSITVSNDGNGNITLGGSGSGTVSSLGGTAGRLAKFTNAQEIGDSLVSESGATVLVTGDLNVTGSITLGSPVAVANGGTGAALLGANGVLVGNGSSAITSIVAGGAGLCLVSTGGAPTWANCNPASNTVNSLNGLTGTLTIANATGLVNTITIDDASTSNKGIAQFNNTNFNVSGGNVNTAQNISTGSSPTFSALTLSGNLTVQGGTSTLGTVTQAGSIVLSDGSSHTVTIVADNLSNNRIYTLPDAGGDATLCVTAGNCIGGGGGAPNTADYLVTSLNGTLTNERALANGSNITLTDGGANASLTIATVQNPTFTTSVTTPTLQSSGALVISSAAGNTVAIDAATTIELQDSSNVTGTLDVSVALNVGASDAFAVSSGGAITAAAGITSSGTIIFSGLNCTGNANGGALTTNGLGQLVCGDDDGGAGGGISGSGTSGTIPLFNGAASITNSIITQSGSTISIAGDLTLTTDLTVANGGTGASSFTSNGVLYGGGSGAIQVTAAGTSGQVLVANGSGVPTFVSFSGDVNVSNTGVTSIQPNSVALGTDTAGDYIANLGALTGLNTSGNTGEGSTPTLSVAYGSIANTAVQGNVTLICPSGTGNLTGGGTSITLGTGGTCANLNTVTNPSFTTSVTTPNLILTGAGSNGSIVLDNLGQSTIYTLPDPNQAAVDICLSIGNCGTAGTAGGDLTGTYPNPTIASFQGTDVDISSPLAGHILVWNGTNSAWENHAVSSDITIDETGVATIQSNAVALGGDTTGNYVIGLTAGNGISVGGSAGEGWSPSVAVIYGSSANTAVQGNTSVTVTAGTNLTGGGSITLGAGGTVTLNVSSSPIFSGTLTVQGATATVGTTSVQGGVVIHDGAGETGTIQTDASLAQSVTYTLPDPGQATADICLSTGNCAGAGSGVTGSGTTNRLSKFTGAQAIGDSLVSDDGSTVAITGSGNFVVQGGTATLGTLTQPGTLSVSDGSNHTISIIAAGVANDRTFTLPETGGAATFCMSTGNCIGGGGGGAPNDATYLLASLNGTLTNDRALASGSNISFTDGGANGNFTVATVQNPTFTTSVTTPQLQSSGALAISSGSGTVAIDATTTIELQDSTNVTGVLDVSASLNVGTSNAFAVSSGGAVTAATGITSSGTITFGGLDCTTFANGGSVTTDSSGVLSCSDDDGAAANTITGSGTTGTIALFSGTNAIGDSVITQSGSVVTITGSLTLTTDLTVANGGTGASSFTSNGVLYGGGSGAIQVTTAGTSGQVLVANGSGVPTFVSFTGDVAVAANGATTIQANSVALGADTTGDYVANLGTTTGLTVGSNSGEGSAPTLSVNYGSGANTAVQGNTTLTCPSGTGNLTGGGTSITLGTGGTCANINTVTNPTFTTSVTTPNLILTGAGSNGSIVLDNLGQSTTFTLPDPNQATADICLSTGNCTAVGTAGGDLTGSYPNPTIAELQGTTLTINSVASGNILQYNGTAWVNQSISGDIALNSSAVATIQANSVALAVDTTGDYVANLGALTGLTTGGNSGEGSTPTLSVAYGSGANTAVQGNVTLTCPSGTGNLSGGGMSITLGTGGTCGNITITNSPTFSGTLTVNTIDATGAMSIGNSAQSLTLQGNATTELTATDSGNTTTVGFATPVADIDILFPALASGGPYTVCTSSGNCGGVGATLQTAYANSTGGVTAEILLDSTRNAVTIRDNSTPIVGNLFEVENNAASTTYFAVTSAGTETTGTIISSGDINTTGGGINTGAGAGTQRIDNSGNLVSIGNITASGNIILFDSAAGDAITLGDSLAGSQDTVTLNGDINLGTDTDADTIVLGDGGNADTFSLNSTGLRISTVGSLTNVGANITGSAGLSVATTGANALNLTGGAASTWDVNGTLSLQTTNNAAITTGTGLWTQGGNLTFGGTAARTITGPSTGGLTMTVASGPLTLSTTTSGTLAVTSAGALNLTGAANSTWTVGSNTLGITSSNFNVSTGGVLNVVGGSAGFQIGGAAATGNYLRGNGTSFVSSAIQAADIPDLGASYIRNQTSQQTSANFNILSAAAGSIGGQIQGAASSTAAVMVLKGGATPGAGADLLQLQTSSATVAKFDSAGNLQGVNVATATTGTTTGTGTNTTTLTLTSDAFSVNDVVLIDNAGQDYYTRITADPGTGSYTVSPAVTFETGRTVTKYNIQNFGATATDYTTQTNRFFQGYFLGGIVAGAGSTTLSDGRLASTGRLNFNSTDVVIQNTVDSTTALQVQNASGMSMINIDTTNKATTIGSVAASALLSAKVDYATASSPLGAATADFDKDGDMDMAVANSGPNTVSVFMSNGNGTFAAKVDYAVGTSPSYIATADFDKDGDMDMAVTNGGAATVSILLNNGSGSNFTLGSTLTAGTNPRNIIATDFDKDGDLDLAVTNYSVTTFSVFMNNGSGTFAAKVDYSTDFTPFGITSADFDKDGDLDVAVADNDSDEVSIFMNNGSGTFAAKVDYDIFGTAFIGEDPNGLVSGDVDKDGDVDLVTANDTSNTLSVMFNSGGTFNTVVEYDTGVTPTNLVIVDIDKDGDLDLVTTNRGSGTVSVFKNNGNGTFAAKLDYTAASNVYGVVAADFDKDGDIDIAATNNGPGTVSVFVNTTLAVSPTSTPTLTLYSGGVNDVLQVRSTDDRRLMSVDARGNTTIGDTSNSAGTLFARKSDTSGTISSAYGITSADLDKDGDNDLAVVALGSDTVDVMMNSGHGSFGSPGSNGVGSTPIDVTAADFDKDGDIDLAVTNEGDDNVSILLNLGNGNFPPPVNYTVGDQPEGIISADFDKDGDIDVVTANRGTGDNISILKNNGTGTFAAKVDYALPAGGNPYHLDAADFDKDGDLDVVTANQGGNASVLMNSGTGTFAAAVNYTVGGTGAQAVKTADFDKDGDIDFATGNSNSISVFLNSGTGTFAAKVDYTTSWIQDMTVGDFDRDSDIDIVGVNDSSPGAARVLLNNGNGTFASTTLDHTTADFPIAVTAADFDKDGDLDLATANEVADNASILKNNTIDDTRFKVLRGDSMPVFTINPDNAVLEISNLNIFAYGNATFQNLTNSALGFRVLNASGGAALVMDTLNTRLGIGLTTPHSTLDIAGRKIFDVFVNQGSDTVDRYYRLADIESNAGEIKIDGILAGHTKTEGKGNISLKFSARDGFLVTGSAMGTIGTGSDILVYYDGSNFYDVWLKTDAWALANLEVTTAVGTSDRIKYDGSYQTATPSGTLSFTLSTDTSATILRMDNSGAFSMRGGGLNLNVTDATAGLFVLDTKNTTGDPVTGLTNGAMYYNSYTNKFRCYEDTRWTNCTSSSFEYDITDLVDDFLTGGITSGAAGSTGWSMYNSISGATLLPVAGVQNHPGITRIGSGTTTNNITSMVADGTNGVSTFVAGDADYFAAIVRPDSGTSTMSTRIGILNSSLASGEASQGMYFSYTGSGNWRTVTRDATNITVNTTSTAYAAGTWYRLEIKRNNSGNWEFFINGTLQFTHSANIPTSGITMAPAFVIETNNTTAKTLDIDWTRFRSRVLSR